MNFQVFESNERLPGRKDRGIITPILEWLKLSPRKGRRGLRISIKSNNNDSDYDFNKKYQYRKHPNSNNGIMQKSVKKFNKMLLRYFEWTYHAPYSTVLVSFLLGFIFMVLLFTAIFVILGKIHSREGSTECMGGGGNLISFNDSFTLSWTTFSTVGYGMLHPVSSGPIENFVCMDLNFACSIESFIGILYAGFCSAVFFNKVLRARSNAPIIFSNIGCVRYGSGLRLDSKASQAVDSLSLFPSRLEGSINKFPALEFRLLNSNSRRIDCELIDSQLKGCLIISAKRSTGSGMLSRERSGSLTTISNRTIGMVNSKQLDQYKARVTEGYPTSKMDQRTFQDIKFEVSRHPLFDRSWLVRHVLNVDSPLLSKETKALIMESGGEWPQELNNPRDMRDALTDFDQIVLSISAVNNFTEIYYYDEKFKRTVIDESLNSDFVEQIGGGGENLRFSDKSLCTRNNTYMNGDDSLSDSVIYNDNAVVSEE